MTRAGQHTRVQCEEPATGPRDWFGFEALPNAVYVPRPGRTDRLSVISWRRGPDDTSPVFTGSRLHPRTLVIAWAADRAGFVDLERAGASPVLAWELTPALFEDLQVLHCDFHLGRHDLLVAGADRVRLAPCGETLQRVVPIRFPLLHRRIKDAVLGLEAER